MTDAKFNAALGCLVGEAYILRLDIDKMKATIEVCPNCSQRYAAEAEKLGVLSALAEYIMFALTNLKRGSETKGGAADEPGRRE